MEIAKPHDDKICIICNKLRHKSKDPELCSNCLRQKKNCTHCNIIHYRQGVTCSNICAYELKKQSWMNSCGTPHNFSKKSNSRLKWEKRILDEEGISNIFQRDSVKRKIVDTIISRFGVDNV